MHQKCKTKESLIENITQVSQKCQNEGPYPTEQQQKVPKKSKIGKIRNGHDDYLIKTIFQIPLKWEKGDPLPTGGQAKVPKKT